MTSIVIVLLLALAFVYINGFHDTANSIATVVATRALSPRQAIVLATLTNLAGALVGTAVAETIARDLVDPSVITIYTIIGALLGAIFWNLVTWWWGLPSSSSHALIGGLCGATLASAHGNWHVIKWAVTDPVTHKTGGLLYKVVIPMFCPPSVAASWVSCSWAFCSGLFAAGIPPPSTRCLARRKLAAPRG